MVIMTTQYVTVEIGTQSCARGRVFNGRGLVRGYNGFWLGRRDDGHINSLGVWLEGTAGGTLRGAWGSVLGCLLGSSAVVRACLVVRVRLCGGAPVVAKISASCLMASMVWAPKQAKGVAGEGFARAPTRRLVASMAASAEDMAGMAPLCGKNWTVLVMRSPRVFSIKMW